MNGETKKRWAGAVEQVRKLAVQKREANAKFREMYASILYHAELEKAGITKDQVQSQIIGGYPNFPPGGPTHRLDAERYFSGWTFGVFLKEPQGQVVWFEEPVPKVSQLDAEQLESPAMRKARRTYRPQEAATGRARDIIDALESPKRVLRDLGMDKLLTALKVRLGFKEEGIAKLVKQVGNRRYDLTHFITHAPKTYVGPYGQGRERRWRFELWDHDEDRGPGWGLTAEHSDIGDGAVIELLRAYGLRGVGEAKEDPRSVFGKLERFSVDREVTLRWLRREAVVPATVEIQSLKGGNYIYSPDARLVVVAKVSQGFDKEANALRIALHRYWVDFASKGVLAQALRQWRNFYGAPLKIDGQDAGKVGYHNPELTRLAR
jgi:hypothetical protein